MNVNLKALFAAIDRRDTDAFLAFLHDEAVFRYGSGEPVQGKENIRAAVAGFFGTIKALRHNVFECLPSRDVIVCRGDVTYTRQDDKQITLPFVNFFRLEGQTIREYLIYIDPAPLFA